MRSMAFYDKLSDLNVALYGGAKDFEYFKHISEPKIQEFKNTVKPYLKDGIIPTIQQKINGLKPIK